MFGRKKNTLELQSYKFPISKSFRGFKRFSVIQHGIGDSEKNCAQLSGMDISKSYISFVEKLSKDGQMYFEVYIDDKQIGSVFDSDQIQSIRSGMITDVHIHFEAEEVITQTSTEERKKAKVFVKYKE